ncbi:MAG: hypothetical protein H6738_05205 [Alphaproteobacteria bacterium]|nr:hypothetical protein [Alphaproteobacteria bacterium]MCB9696164.1 hypothetical protein [Alphaproteobacteria bacterium]
MKLDPSDLVSWATRDWEAPERLSREARARLPVEDKVRIAISLYEAALATAGKPDDRARLADLEHHLRVKALLTRAAHVGRR